MNLLNQDYTVELDQGTAGEAPTEIELIPREGKIVGRDGRSWLNDQPRTIISAFNQDGLKLPIDLEHSTQQKAPQGDPAPAVGWIVKLYLNPYGAIWGTIEWTSQGRNLIESRAYRYISPVFTYDRSTTSIVKLVSAGLTNRPNLFLQALNRVDPTFSHYSLATNSLYASPTPAPEPLSAQELKICNMMGIDPHEYIQANAANLARPTPVAVNSSEPSTAHGLGREELKIINMMGISPDEYIAANAIRTTSQFPLSMNSQQPGVALGLSREDLRVCELTGVSPADYLGTVQQEHAVGRNQQGESLEELEIRIAKLVGIPLADIPKIKARVAKELEAYTPLTAEEVKACRSLGVEPLLEFYAARLVAAGLKPQLRA
jgi:hypothetical protein